MRRPSSRPSDSASSRGDSSGQPRKLGLVRNRVSGRSPIRTDDHTNYARADTAGFSQWHSSGMPPPSTSVRRIECGQALGAAAGARITANQNLQLAARAGMIRTAVTPTRGDALLDCLAGPTVGGALFCTRCGSFHEPRGVTLIQGLHRRQPRRLPPGARSCTLGRGSCRNARRRGLGLGAARPLRPGRFA
jgi:hypothetical protein